jgi:two-component system nitrogen regulation response regulator NtrX
MSKILVIDDEKSIRNTLKEVLEYEKHEVDLAEDGPKGLDMFSANTYDIVLCDIKMAKMDGIEVLGKIHESSYDTPIIMISGHGNIDTAVEAIKKGAYDFLEKPLDLNRLLITIRNAMDKSTLITQTQVLKNKVSRMYEIVGESEAIEKVKKMIDRVAPTEARVLITGSNGTGKELVAHQIHEKKVTGQRIHLLKSIVQLYHPNLLKVSFLVTKRARSPQLSNRELASLSRQTGVPFFSMR